ncbi:response regulator [Sphingobacterium chungjuense]|uniref:response regulator n=1 Tax=Sphingobacterium chungjuense TaxID=2675553 RepID=UPI00140CD649|nr:response regulator [Sphingobacterium chungjuense]
MNNILVIEDDLMFCKLVSNYLNKNGHQASQATDGASAKEQLQRTEFDVALVDYRLPDTNGVDLVRWIKENTSVSKVIVMSRMLDEQLREEAQSLGVTTFLNKPFNPSELLALLK